MKLAVLPPAAIVTLETWVPPLKNSPVLELEARLTVWPPVPAVAVLLYGSSSCTVIVPEVVLVVSILPRGEDQLGSGGGGDGFLLRIGKETADGGGEGGRAHGGVFVLEAGGAVAGGDGDAGAGDALPLASRNVPVVLFELSAIACPMPFASTGLPEASSDCTVIVPEATPAVSAWAAVVKTKCVGAAITVSVCVALAIPATWLVAVSMGLPAAVSLYSKLAEPPVGMTKLSSGFPLGS